MSVEKVVTESWSSRLGSSFKGVIAGGLLFLGGIPLLFWNEGRAVKTTKALEEGEAACVSLPNVDSVDPAYEGKIVHATGTAATQDVLTDDRFAAVNIKAMKLRRTVEYYQWVETEHVREDKQMGGSAKKVYSYTYDTKWVSKPVAHEGFHEGGHVNTVAYPGVLDKELKAENVTFGSFNLTPSQINRISGEKPVALTKDMKWPDELAGCVDVLNNELYIGAKPNYVSTGQPAVPVAPMLQPVPAERVMQVPTVSMGGFVTVPSIQPMRMAVSNVDGVPFVVMPDETAVALLTPGSIMYNGMMHPITETVPGNNTVFNPNAAANVVYLNIANYGSLPMFKVENKDFVRLPEGSITRVISQNGAYQVLVNGMYQPATLSREPQMPAPVRAAVAVPGQVGMPGVVTSTVNPASPKVGDVRIKWTYVPDTMPVSIVAQQMGNSFAPYIAENGYEVDLLNVGTHSRQAMFQKAHDSNTMMTLLLRLGGWFMMFMGLKMVLKPLSVLGDVIPVIGSIIEFGAGIIAFIVSATVALVVIAIAWLFYRPVVAIVLLAIAGALIYWAIKRKKGGAPVVEKPAES